MAAILHQAGVVVHVHTSVPPRQGDGGEAKPRFVLLMSDLEDDGEPVLGLPVTTLIRPDLKDISFHLPFNRNNTRGLNQPSVVVCDWTVEVTAADVDRHAGAIPNSLLDNIWDKLNELFG